MAALPGLFRSILFLLGVLAHLKECNAAGSYDFDSGILKRVTERLDAVMTVPVQAISIMERFHNNQGFRPHGLHAQGGSRVQSYLFSLIHSFNDLKLYFGTEAGEYFTYFETDAVYREPGNSGYEPDDPEMQKYWPICVDGNDGSQQNCQMAEGANYIQCVDDCQLVRCADEASQQNCSLLSGSPEEMQACEDEIKWCPSYTIEKATGTLGFVPLGYYCINEMGLFSQDQGKVLGMVQPEDAEPYIIKDGRCTYWDETPVSRVPPAGPFEFCGGGGESCNHTYTGLIRTLDYDPRQRPWYIETKENQKSSWSTPYPFHTHSNIITKIGITYAHPFYTKAKDGKTVFEGVFAVDYTLYDISLFLTENYGDTDDLVVVVFEAADPHYLIGISSGTNPYREVLTSDESIPCSEQDEDCVTVRVPASDIGNTTVLDHIASRAVQAQVRAGFPVDETVTVKETDDRFSASYFSQIVKYKQPETDLEWVVLVASPMERASSDSLQAGDMLFITLIFVAAAGSIGCSILFALWFGHRKKRAVMHGDFIFTSAFIAGCILLNLSSLSLLGENTDAMCMTRFWLPNLSFSLALAPLLVKVYRVYKLVGRGMKRKQLTHSQAALRTLPIIALEVAILVIFTFTDPARSVEEIDFDASVPRQHITCGHDSKAFIITETVFKSCVVVVGCVLSFLSRNLDSRFGEAKQLLFGMYNIAFTGGCLLVMVGFVDTTPDAVSMFRATGVFWGTVLTCAVFVVPRLIQARDVAKRSSSVRVSGLMGPSVQFSLPPSTEAFKMSQPKVGDAKPFSIGESSETSEGLKGEETW